MNTKAAACLAATTSAALSLGTPLSWAGGALALLTTALVVLYPHTLGMDVLLYLAGAGMAFLGQSYYGLRVLLDARLFALLAARLNSECEADTLVTELGYLDQALYSLKLAPKPSAPPRPLDARVQGALRLLKCQAGCLLGQLILLAAALLSSL
ncbi:MAG: hypothetical protein U1F46_02635 [Marinagarivorans sp.]